jgi:phage protein D
MAGLIDIDDSSSGGKAKAKKKARKALRHKNKKERRSNFKLPGTLRYVAGTTIMTAGFGKLFSVKWIIERVDHTVSDAKFSTEVEMRWVLNY